MRKIVEKYFYHITWLFSDIKPENIMCQTRNSTNVKLIDFGLATKLDPNEVVKISTGTAEFAAPEIVEREPVGFYTDMWACGVLAYVLWVDLIFYFYWNNIKKKKRLLVINAIRRFFKIYYYNLHLFRLSGLSPFAGDNDIETLKNVKACDWDFDEEAFRDVSEEGKDFIRRLLVKNKEYVLH